ncbi:MAG: hypothetical protein AAGD88_01110 [Bacteroidota bacterium]
MKKHVILVAGYEYHHGRTNLTRLCKQRANVILHQRASWHNDAEVKFTLFDVKNGQIETGRVNRNQIDWSLERDDFDAIDDGSHYTAERHFVQRETDVISVTDAYKYLQDVGNNDSGTLHEFTLLGHGWRGGPVLVNSYQRSDYLRNGSNAMARDPWDKDGRQKDTNLTNMGMVEWQRFVQAFNGSGHVWVWGCASSRLFKTVILKVLRSPEFGNKRYGSHVDTDTFTLRFNRSFAEEYFGYDTLFFFRSRTSSAITELSLTRTFREVKDFLIRGMVHTYAAQMAYNTGVKVYAALPGTGADYERGGRANRRVMVVPKNTSVYGYGYNSILRFYKTYLSMQEDPEQRGYALYDPLQITRWKSG